MRRSPTHPDPTHPDPTSSESRQPTTSVAHRSPLHRAFSLPAWLRQSGRRLLAVAPYFAAYLSLLEPAAVLSDRARVAARRAY